MKVEIDGIRYTNFISSMCMLRLDTLSSFFKFTVSVDENTPLPFLTGQECTVYIDGVLVLTGHIESMVVDYDSTKHTITYAGRDKTADLLDSTLGAIDNISGQELTIKATIERVIAHLGLNIKVIDEARPKQFSQSEDLPSPEIGQNAFEFIERIARKRQVLLTSNADGNIVIKRNDGTTGDGVIQHAPNADDNNVITATFTKNTSDQFRLYKVSSGMNIAAGAEAGGSLDSLTNQSGSVLDEDIRSGRQMIVIAETPTGENIKDRAIWEAGVRKARSTTYQCSVSGYRVGGDSGSLWEPSKLYLVRDSFIQLNREMLCNAVTFSFNEEGKKADLELIGRDAYRLELSSGVETFGVLLSDAN